MNRLTRWLSVGWQQTKRVHLITGLVAGWSLAIFLTPQQLIVSNSAAALIGGPLLVAAFTFFLMWLETRRIHTVVNSRLTEALQRISDLEGTISELRSTPESREAAKED